MSEIERVTLKQAAKELGVSQATLRSWMRHEHVKIGVADKKEGKSKFCYIIFRHLLDKEKERLANQQKGDEKDVF